MTMTFQHDDLPLALYSAAQVRDLDARLIAAGTPGFELMQRAATPPGVPCAAVGRRPRR
ncbi:putative carbohydrate kinase [Pseudomonas aeruginosa]|nr:putative carbohydrate kinase [Pseudomonas aeruginosa]